MHMNILEKTCSDDKTYSKQPLEAEEPTSIMNPNKKLEKPTDTHA